MGTLERYLGAKVCIPPLLYHITTYGGIFTRYTFSNTLLIGGTFGIAAGGANSFVALAILVALVGMGVGGRPSFPL